MNKETGQTRRGPKPSRLILLPPLSPARVDEARELWAVERVNNAERRERLREEESRIASLQAGPRGQDLRRIYGNVVDKPNQGTSVKFAESADDALVFFRIALGESLGFSLPIDPTNKTLVDKLIKVEAGIIPRLKVGAVLNGFFPSHREALIAAYPSLELQPFHFPSLPTSYWTDKEHGRAHAQQAIRWRFEDEMNGPKVEPLTYREWLSGVRLERELGKHNIYNRVLRIYDRVSSAVIDAYPELDMNPWEFRMRHSDEEREVVAIKATQWLIEQRLGLSPDSPDFEKNIKEVRAKHFSQAGLSTYISGSDKPGGGSFINLLKLAYPDHDFSEQSFSRFSANTWQGEEGLKRAQDFTKRMIGEKIGLDSSDPEFRIKLATVRRSDFDQAGLSGMLRTVYGQSIYRAIKDAYPEGDLKEWELPVVPNNFWKENDFVNVGRAIRWYAEEQLRFEPSAPDFKDNIISITASSWTVLRTLLHATNLTLLEALRISYPNLEIREVEFRAANRMREMRYQKKPEIKVTKDEANAGLDSLFED